MVSNCYHHRVAVPFSFPGHKLYVTVYQYHLCHINVNISSMGHIVGYFHDASDVVE